MKTREPRDQHLVVLVRPSELAEIDDYQWHNRLKSRAAAVRQLITYGIAENVGPAAARTAPGLGSSNPREGKADEHQTA